MNLSRHLRAPILFGTDRSGVATTLGNAAVKSSEKTDVSTMSVPDPYFGYRYGRYSPWVGYNQETVVRQYTEGTLTVDPVDRARKQLVWSGAAFGRVTDKVRNNPQAAVR